MLAVGGFSESSLSNRPGKRGELKLTLGLKEGRTIIKEAYNRVPLKIAKPFYLEPESGEIFIYQMNPGGGMVQGDDYYQEITIEPGAQVFLTTQSAAKIYRSPNSYTRQINLFKLGANALLEYFPDPLIPFAGSRYQGETKVCLSKGSTAFIAEIVTPGRIKRDEVFQYDYFQSKTRVYWEEQLILWDNWRLEPGKGNMKALGMYDGFTHQGSFFIFSERVSQSLVEKIQEILVNNDKVLAGASLTVKNGIAIRILGRRADQMEKVIMGCWDLLRRELVGLPKPRIRKY